MKITVVSASTRPSSQSLKVADYLSNKLESLGSETALVDLNALRLPLYDDSKSGDWEAVWRSIEADLDSGDGFVFVSPEWDGMFSAGLHNLFHYVANMSNHVLAHKPVMLVGVSAGLGGAYPIAQMKMLGQKNTKFVIVPENLRFAKVREVLVDGEISVDDLRDRTDYSLKLLIEYAKALQPVRTLDLLDFDRFGTGV